MSKEEFIEKIKEIKVNVPNEEFFIEYNKEIYKILDENERMSKMINRSISINDYKKLKETIDKAIEYIKNTRVDNNYMVQEKYEYLLKILKGEDNA